jgi:hypothetical protein
LERVLACAQAKPEQVAELKTLRQSLDPFQLGKLIDQKLQRIYDLANRRLSPKVPESCGAPAQKEKQPDRRNGCGKPPGGKVPNQTFPPGLQIAQKARDSHFPTANGETLRTTQCTGRR